MPERGHPRWAGGAMLRKTDDALDRGRARLSVALLAAALSTSCVQKYVDDAGLKEPLAKDRGAGDDSGDPQPDAGDMDTGIADNGVHPDAARPDAAPASDNDRDGIPNAEDPRPDSANGALFVDTFEAIVPDWLFTSAAMRVEPARSVLRVPEPEPFVREGWLGARPQWTDVFIRALVRVDRLGPGNDPGSGRVGVLARIQQVAPDRYLLCGADLRTNEVFLSEHNGGDAAGNTLATAPIAPEPGTWIPINFSVYGNGLRCKVAGVEVTGNSTLYIGGSAGIRVFSAAMEADWFEVYDY